MRPVPLAKKIKIKNTTKFLCSSFVLITLIGCAELEAKFVWLGRQDGLLVGHKNKGNWTRWQHLLMTQIGDCSKTLEKLMANTCCLHNFIAWFPPYPVLIFINWNFFWPDLKPAAWCSHRLVVGCGFLSFVALELASVNNSVPLPPLSSAETMNEWINKVMK